MYFKLAGMLYSSANALLRTQIVPSKQLEWSMFYPYPVVRIAKDLAAETLVWYHKFIRKELIIIAQKS